MAFPINNHLSGIMAAKAALNAPLERFSSGLRQPPSEDASTSEALKQQLTTVTGVSNTERTHNELTTTPTTAVGQAQGTATLAPTVSQPVNTLTLSTIGIGKTSVSQTMSPGFAVSQYQRHSTPTAAQASGVATTLGNTSDSRGQVQALQGETLALTKQQQNLHQNMLAASTQLDTRKQALHAAAYLPAVNPGALGFSVRA